MLVAEIVNCGLGKAERLPYHGVNALVEWYGAVLADGVEDTLHVSKERLHGHVGNGMVEHCVRCHSWLQEQGQDSYKK